MRIALVANTSWYLYNFRRNLARVLIAHGHEVIAFAAQDDYSPRLVAEGVGFRATPFTGSGTNPIREALTVVSLRKGLRRQRIDAVLSYTPKGNIYASLASLGSRILVIANVSGLGRSFSGPGSLRRLVARLYRFTLLRAAWVYFQNGEDQSGFIENGLVDPGRCSRLPGSGVDLDRFSGQPAGCDWRKPSRPTRFLFVARLLWDKGIGEYVEAARAVRARHPGARFGVLGGIDPPGSAAVPQSTLQQWQAEGIVEYFGTTDDVRPHLSDADCVVLPSVYREGVPRSLLEAAAMARPIIAADSVGCRDTVDDGVSGYLCKPRDASDLAACMLRFLDLPAPERAAMGLHGRRKMEREFDERFVLDSYLRTLRALSVRNAARQGQAFPG